MTPIKQALINPAILALEQPQNTKDKGKKIFLCTERYIDENMGFAVTLTC
jgi:hypothetical protein